MFLKKFLNQPNLIGTLFIALLIGSGVVFAFGFDGFNVQAIAKSGCGDGIDTLLRLSESGNCGDDTCNCTGGRGTLTCDSSCDSSQTKCNVIDECITGCSNCDEGKAFGKPCKDGVHCENMDGRSSTCVEVCS